MTATVTDGPTGGLGRAAATITLWNLVSRIMGFVRVLATAGALGIAVLGDTYQRSNQVSNLLFELLAGGMLFSVLVPTFVAHLRSEPVQRVAGLAGALATRATAVMAVVVGLGLLFAEPLMSALAAGADPATRDRQIELGVFLLWFVLPQLLLYAVGSVASALLQADHRFVATSVAPACNSIVVTVTMVAFAVVHDPSRGLDLTGGEKLLLGGGTLLGTAVMTAVPLVAAARAGYAIRPGWAVPSGELGPLVRRGAWAAGHVGCNQVLVIATVVLAGAVDGGVIAYQTAFTFFLLPHALLAHPIFTAIYPRLSSAAGEAANERFTEQLAGGLRSMVALVVPGAAVLAAVAAPALSLVRVGQLDRDGVELVAATLAAYLVGLAGYSASFLLTRAAYALGDARRPTVVTVWVTAANVAAMAVVAVVLEGTAMLVGFGVVTSLAAVGGAVALHRSVVELAGRPVPVAGSVLRTAVGGGAAAALAGAVAVAIGWDGRIAAVASVAAAGAVGAATYVAVLKLLGSSDLDLLASRLRGLVGSRWPGR